MEWSSSAVGYSFATGLFWSRRNDNPQGLLWCEKPSSFVEAGKCFQEVHQLVQQIRSC